MDMQRDEFPVRSVPGQMYYATALGGAGISRDGRGDVLYVKATKRGRGSHQCGPKNARARESVSAALECA